MADDRLLALRDEVSVEAEIRGVSVVLAAVVTNILSDVFWLALPLPDARLTSLTPGQPIDLCFERTGGPMVLHSTFIRRLGGDRLGTEKSRVFAVARPPGLETAERRSDLRVVLDRGVRIRATAADAPRGYVIGTGRTVNIGAGGLQFTTRLPLAVGDEIVLALALSSRAIVTAGAQVTRIADGPCGGSDEPDAFDLDRSRHCVAIRFTRIADSDRERIACYILAARRNLPELRAVIAAPEDAGAAAALDSAGAESPEAPATAEAGIVDGVPASIAAPPVAANSPTPAP